MSVVPVARWAAWESAAPGQAVERVPGRLADTGSVWLARE